MDPTVTPWRALEDPVERTMAGAAPEPPSGSLSRSSLLMAIGVVGLVVVAFALAFGAGASGTTVFDGGIPLGSTDLAAASGELGDAPPSTGPELVVEIVGAVARPGVFRMPSGARIGDLVEAAGGYGTRVDTERASRDLNLAAPLHDGDQVRVPSRDDEFTAGMDPGSGQGASGTSPGSGSSGTGPIDLNTATSAELETLPGIGPVTAAKILTSRDEQRFGAVEDLRTRGLLGEKTYEKIRDLVMVR